MNKKAGKWRCTLSLYCERSYTAANGSSVSDGEQLRCLSRKVTWAEWDIRKKNLAGPPGVD